MHSRDFELYDWRRASFASNLISRLKFKPGDCSYLTETQYLSFTTSAFTVRKLLVRTQAIVCSFYDVEEG